MKKMDILIPYNEIIKKRNEKLKVLLKQSKDNPVSDLKNDYDEEYIKELETLINNLIYKIDQEEHSYKVCINCKHYNEDPYTSKEGICNFINSPVPTLTKPNRTCDSFTSRKK